MTGFIEGERRTQATLFPERLDDYIAESSPVRVIDVFVDELELGSLRFKTVRILKPRNNNQNASRTRSPGSRFWKRKCSTDRISKYH